METEKFIDGLNKLLEINNDRTEGYETAAKETEDTELKSRFRMFASQSREFSSQLKSIIRDNSGTPVEGTTTSGKFYRAWMDIKSALSGKDKKAIASSCEFGEDVAKDTYKSVLEEYDLPQDVKTKIVDQQQQILAAHNSIKTLRDSMI